MIGASFILPNLQGDPTRSPVKTASANDLTYSRGYYPIRALPAGLGTTPPPMSADERHLQIAEEQLAISRRGSKLTTVLAIASVIYGTVMLVMTLKARTRK